MISVPGIDDTMEDQEKKEMDRLLAKSLVGDEYTPPDAHTSKRQKKKKQREEREKTAGSAWWDKLLSTLRMK